MPVRGRAAGNRGCPRPRAAVPRLCTATMGPEGPLCPRTNPAGTGGRGGGHESVAHRNRFKPPPSRTWEIYVPPGSATFGGGGFAFHWADCQRRGTPVVPRAARYPGITLWVRAGSETRSQPAGNRWGPE